MNLRLLPALPGLCRSFSADPAHAARGRDLLERLRRLQRELADPLELAATFPVLPTAPHSNPKTK